MRFQETQLAKIVHEIKLAYLSHVPIVYMPTEQIELIRELVYSDRGMKTIIPHLKSGHEIIAESSGITRDGILQNDNYFRNFAPREEIIDSCDQSNKHAQQILNDQNLFVYIGTSWKHECKTRYIINGEPEVKSIETCVADILDYTLYPKLSWDMSENKPNWTRQSVLKDGLQRSLILVCTTHEEPIPEHLMPYSHIVRVPALSDEEIYETIITTLNDFEITINISDGELEKSLKAILIEMRGFSRKRIETLIQTLIFNNVIKHDNINLKSALEFIRFDKKEVLSSCPGLKWEKTEGISEASGLGMITKWLDSYKPIFGDIKKAEDEGLCIPKGILISGIPGSGKSLMAKTAANKLGLPLISLDMGAMRGSHHGESENNLNRALALADSMAPCILWVDEIEKAFSGTSSNSGEGDNGVGKRMFGKFLTWMQEKKSACFVFATANDISNLPPELFRSERFSRKFFTFIPTCEECSMIFANEAKKVNKEYKAKLSNMTPEKRQVMPYSIFDEVVEESSFWNQIINEVAEGLFKTANPFKKGKRFKPNDKDKELPEAYGWINLDEGILTLGPKGHVKLFTGADIASIFKEILHSLWTDKKRVAESSEQIRYLTNDVRAIAKQEIEKYKSYGETNLKDIVKCFIKLYENNFTPASNTCLFDFRRYIDESFLYDIPVDPSNQNIIHLNSCQSGEPFRYNCLDNPIDNHNNEYYNIVMQLSIIAAINYYSPQIKYKIV